MSASVTVNWAFILERNLKGLGLDEDRAKGYSNEMHKWAKTHGLQFKSVSIVPWGSYKTLKANFDKEATSRYWVKDGWYHTTNV